MGGIPLGRAFGVPLRAHWSSLVILLLVGELLAAAVLPSASPGYSTLAYAVAGAAAALVFLGCVLAHELAHAATARRAHLRVKGITLWMLGGQTELQDEAKTARVDLLVGVVGPLTSLVIGGALYGLAIVLHGVASPLIVADVAWLGLVNVVLGVFNLLPGAPLDGGRVLRALIWLRTGSRDRGEAAAARGGRAVGIGLLVAGGLEVVFGALDGLWLVLIGWFLLIAAGSEVAATASARALSGLKVRDVMTPDPVTGPDWMVVEEFLDRIALRRRHSCFPLVDFEGRPSGLVTLAILARVPLESRGSTQVRRVAIPLRNLLVVGPDEPVETLLARLPSTPTRRALVVERGVLVGLVTSHDLNLILQQALLRRVPAPPQPRSQPVMTADRDS